MAKNTLDHLKFLDEVFNGTNTISEPDTLPAATEWKEEVALEIQNELDSPDNSEDIIIPVTRPESDTAAIDINETDDRSEKVTGIPEPIPGGFPHGSIRSKGLFETGIPQYLGDSTSILGAVAVQLPQLPRPTRQSPTPVPLEAKEQEVRKRRPVPKFVRRIVGGVATAAVIVSAPHATYLLRQAENHYGSYTEIDEVIKNRDQLAQPVEDFSNLSDMEKVAFHTGRGAKSIWSLLQ